MGYQTNVDLKRLSPMQIDLAMNEFRTAELMRNKLSLPHKDAIDTTNLGYDWYVRATSTGDFK